MLQREHISKSKWTATEVCDQILSLVLAKGLYELLKKRDVTRELKTYTGKS